MDETGDQYEWDTADIPAGEYYLWAVISDGNNEPLYVVSPVKITLQEGQDSSDQPTPEIPAEPTTEPVEQPTEEPTEEPTQQPTEEPTQPAEVGNEFYSLSSQVMGDGRVVNRIIINGPAEAPAGFTRASINLPMDAAGEIQTTQSMAALIVPAFNWSFGCSATSAAMIAGYYDRNGYDNMYAGPTNGGLMPLDNSAWPDWQDSSGTWRHQTPLSATHLGLDGRVTRGHVDDYWVSYGSTATDPWVAYGSEHTYGDCTGDYMKTNQNQHTYRNSDGSTTFHYYSNGDVLTCSAIDGLGLTDDGTAGFRDFYQSRGYSVNTCYIQTTSNVASSGFTFDQYKAEIDAGYPVMIHVQGHTMVGVGYEGTSTVILHDTWDYENHTMNWGSSYAGMEMWGVSVLHLDPPGPLTPTPIAPTGTITDYTPTYSWSKVALATLYQYQLYKGGTLVYAENVTTSVCDATTCSVTPTTELSGGDYTWRVGAYVYGSWKAFTDPEPFTVDIPLTPSQISPSGMISDTTPTYTWSRIIGATRYQYQLYQDTTRLYAYTVTSSVCGSTTCSDTPPDVLGAGDYTWRVGAYVDETWKAFTAGEPFTVEAPEVTPTTISPEGTITDTTPTYTWSKIDGATRYQYQLYQGSTRLYAYTVSSSVCGSTTCSGTPTTPLGRGDYTWRVGAYVGEAWQPFSASQAFSVEVPMTPTIISPTGTITDTTPTYTWSSIAGAVKYQYQLYEGSTRIYAFTVYPTVCSGSTCSSTPSTALGPGDYTWRVGAYVDGAWRQFSTSEPFTLNAPVVTPTQIAPEGTITDTTPTYSWSKINGATKYQYQLYKNSTLVYAYTVGSSVCGSSTCSSTPTTLIGAGDYAWRVGAYVDGAWRQFSGDMAFTLDAPLTPEQIAPSGDITDTTPTYTWSKIGGAIKYQYQLYSGSTLVYAYTVSSSVCGSTTCSSTPNYALDQGDYTWRVGAYVDGAWRQFSGSKAFTIGRTPLQYSPSGTITDTTPTYQWSMVSGATKYQYQLYQGSTRVYAYNVSYTVCSGSTCSATPTTVLSLGDYTWRVGAYVDGAWRQFSGSESFNISQTPNQIAPSGTISDSTPTYTWSMVSGATRYQYQLYQGSTRLYAYTVLSSVCGSTTCSSTPGTVLNVGDYTWRVGAYVNGAWKQFSGNEEFTLSN